MKPLRGILLIVLAVTFFSLMNSFIKAAGRIPAGEAVFFRSAFALPVIVIWLRGRRELRHGLRSGHFRLHLARGLLGTMAMSLNFLGLHLLPFPEVTALRFTTPVLIVVFAALFLGEGFRMVRLAAVLAGFAGVVLIMWPRLGGQMTGQATGAILVLGSAATAAVAQITLKRLASVEPTPAIVFWFSVISMLLGLASLPLGWVWPSPVEAMLLIGAGLLGGIGQMLLTSSYRFADAGVLAPFTYVSMIWAIAIGWFGFGELPGLATLAGAALIILAGVVIVLRERQLGKRRPADIA